MADLIYRFARGDDSARVEPEQVDRVEDLLDRLAERASTELRATLEREGMAVEAWRTESGGFRGELADPGFTVTCDGLSRTLCSAFDAAPVSPE
ncbi:MAG TPA: hypothetical protein VMT85_17700 [Thermoanaerobaculia bacterium]|nr:hypothetical protein [Thermoanaerobaculia bacterium]